MKLVYVVCVLKFGTRYVVSLHHNVLACSKSNYLFGSNKQSKYHLIITRVSYLYFIMLLMCVLNKWIRHFVPSICHWQLFY